MKDDFMQERRKLRKRWSWEIAGKDDKNINRRICRKRLKIATSKIVLDDGPL